MTRSALCIARSLLARTIAFVTQRVYTQAAVGRDLNGYGGHIARFNTHSYVAAALTSPIGGGAPSNS
jgi:hypothetical protein